MHPRRQILLRRGALTRIRRLRRGQNRWTRSAGTRSCAFCDMYASRPGWIPGKRPHTGLSIDRAPSKLHAREQRRSNSAAPAATAAPPPGGSQTLDTRPLPARPRHRHPSGEGPGAPQQRAPRLDDPSPPASPQPLETASGASRGLKAGSGSARASRTSHNLASGAPTWGGRHGFRSLRRPEISGAPREIESGRIREPQAEADSWSGCQTAARAHTDANLTCIGRNQA